MKTPDLTRITAETTTLLDELAQIDWADRRGGVDWDPFRELPELRISSAAQHQLIWVFHESRNQAVAAEGRLGRARSDSGKSRASRDAFQFNRISDWAQETLLASMSLSLVKRIRLAKERFHRLDEHECMSEAISKTLHCLHIWPEREAGSVFYQYVNASVDALLAEKGRGERFSGTMPDSWKVALSHISPIEEELHTKLGRLPFDKEVGAALLARCREWAGARIEEKSGPQDPKVLDELVTAKLKKQGMLAAVENIHQIRPLCPGHNSLDYTNSDEEEFEVPAEEPDAHEVVSTDHMQSGIQRLLAPIPGVDPADLADAASDENVQRALTSSLWGHLVLKRTIPMEVRNVSRKAPDPLQLVNSY